MENNNLQHLANRNLCHRIFQDRHWNINIYILLAYIPDHELNDVLSLSWLVRFISILRAYLLYRNRFRFPKLSVPIKMVSTVSHKPKLVSSISQNGLFQFSAILSIFWKMKIKWFYDIIVMFSFIGGLKGVTINTLNYSHSNTIKTTTK